MNPLNEVMSNLLQNTDTTNSHSNPYVCPHCNEVVPVIEKNILGKVRRIQPVCECEAQAMKQEEIDRAKFQERRKIRELFSLSDLGEKFKESTFENFIAMQGTENAYKFSKRYADEFDNDVWKGIALLLWGVPGNGKSLLAASVANALESKGKTVVFISMPNLLQKIRSTFNQENNRETEQEIMKALHTCDLLVLDDIGAEKVTDWVEDIIFRIVDGRYTRKKPIFITSNLNPDLLAAKIGVRSMDRLIEMCQTIHNKGGSYRKIKAAENFKRILEN